MLMLMTQWVQVIRNIIDNKVVIPIIFLIKQIKPTNQMAALCFHTFNKEPKLCTVSHLIEYLKRTKSCRDTGKLFLTYIKPYRAASRDGISRWCKSIINESGISIHNDICHSSRGAASILYKVLWSIVMNNYSECRLEMGENFLLVLRQINWKRSWVSRLFAQRKIRFYKWFVKVYCQRVTLLVHKFILRI